jgi:hypothetical protein
MRGYLQDRFLINSYCSAFQRIRMHVTFDRAFNLLDAIRPYFVLASITYATYINTFIVNSKRARLTNSLSTPLWISLPSILRIDISHLVTKTRTVTIYSFLNPSIHTMFCHRWWRINTFMVKITRCCITSYTMSMKRIGAYGFNRCIILYKVIISTF